MRKRYSLLAGLTILLSVHIQAQINLTTPNGSYSEDFDVMGSTGTSLPTGWTAIRIAGTGTIGQTLAPVVSNGSNNAGGIYNAGTTGSADRALGTLASGSTTPAFGISFINNTGTTITDFLLSGFSEQWRTGSNAQVERVVFEYSTNATSLNTGTWTAVSTLDLVEVLTSNNSNTAVDGNDPANRTAISGAISSINLANGNTLWIRWTDQDNTGNDGMYALDDFKMAWTNASGNNSVTIAAGISAAEPATNGTFIITLSSPAPAGGVTVNYTLSGTATLNSDYTDPQNGTISIEEGATTGTIIINVLDDAINEGVETITATLTSASASYSVSTTPATINLLDDEAITLYAFTFNSCTGTLSDGFMQQNITGSQVWGCTTFGRTGNAVQINGFVTGSGNQANEDWLISPPIDLSGTAVPLLSFYSRSAFNGAPLQLFVTTNYTGDVTTTAWTEVNGHFPAPGSDVWTLSNDINLSSFKQANVRFAFKYVSTTAASSRWTIDDIQVLDASVAPPPVLTINGKLLDFRQEASGNTSASKSITFWGENFVEDLTLKAPAGYVLSKDNNTFSTSITYTTAELEAGQKTVFVRFVPTVANTVYAGYLSFVSGGRDQQGIFVKGNSYPFMSTLNVVNWNVKWFGSPAQAPADDNLQQANVKTVLEYLNADVYALAEVVDTTRLGNLVRSLSGGYSYVVSDYASGAFDPAAASFAGNYATGQKLALVYRNAVVSNIQARGLMRTSSSAITNWANGRVPFLVRADVTKNGTTNKIDFIVIHAKANTGTT
ncbi:MAG: choice-of-anchor J domain-containing protein, partial [Flavisolibacter sp.]|nr:choice-of-anchor J domain-containing protein [Flavisolibacter sp.]